METQNQDLTEIPKVDDLIDINHLAKVVHDANSSAVGVTDRFFKKGARKAPITKQSLHRLVASSNLVGHMQAVEGLMSFLENAEIVDGFDPDHDFVQALYGELCMYLLKLDKILFQQYGIKSSVNTDMIHERTEEYLQKFFHRRERINELQIKLKKDEDKTND